MASNLGAAEVVVVAAEVAEVVRLEVKEEVAMSNGNKWEGSRVELKYFSHL